MPTAAELLAALPADQSEATPNHQAELETILNRLADKPVPPGAFQRFCSLSGLSAKLGIGYAAYLLRSLYQPKEAREKDLVETSLRGAVHTLETMSYLRGAVSKVGQLMSSLPHIVPDEFIDALSELHFNAPPMHYALIREQLLNELGEPSDIFSDFDEQAIAAASIGQVHKARLKSGEDVAVKIQYPGIARSIRSDLRNLKTVMRPVLFNDNWRAFTDLLDEIRSGLEYEADYEHEAQNLLDVRKLFVDDEDIYVPNVFAEYSTQRVLTMEFVAGKTLDEYLATNPSQAERNRYGTQISKALFRCYGNNLLYTDPHPGNFIFMDDGRLGFIDFGNIRRCNEEEWDFIQEASRTRFGDDETMRATCKRSLMMTDEEARKRPEVLDLIVEMLRFHNEPIIYEGEFDYGDPKYLQQGAEILARCSKMKWVRQRKQNVFAHRLNFLLPALLFRLKSCVNVPEMLRAEDPNWA